ATLGINDSVRPRGSVVFGILGDGAVLHETTVLTGTSEPQLCRVDVTGVTLLTLVTDYGDALDLADHADWGGARLLRPADFKRKRRPSPSRTSLFGRQR
ncbi:MAG: NPCBM/NEW2 domain-containing protein, partial [Planctomycetes bacterium]|nr:NPCBM/NEW2 domain-containing protein [Planctomycetota bacterium]